MPFFGRFALSYAYSTPNSGQIKPFFLRDFSTLAPDLQNPPWGSHLPRQLTLLYRAYLSASSGFA
jgi:hypothetical protein